MGGVKKQRHHHDELTSEDLLYMIFSKLDKKIDRDSFGLTCHRFLNIQNSSRKHLELPLLCCSDRPISDPIYFILNKLLNRFTQLKSLSLKSYNVTEIGLNYIASVCPLLSVINLCRCSTITDDGLKILTSSCRLLTQVDIGWCSSVTDCGLGYVNRNCRQLQALRISGCDKILGESFQDCSPTLTCLEAIHCAFSFKGVTALLSGGGVEYLNLSFPCDCPWGHGLGVIGLGFGENIKFLNFENCRKVADDDIIKISKGCPLLQEWNLSCCNEITFTGWQSIGLYCQNLEILNVNRCRYFNDRSLLALAKGCIRLSVMYMSNCRKITPSGKCSFKKYRHDVELKVEEGEERITTSWALTE